MKSYGVEQRIPKDLMVHYHEDILPHIRRQKLAMMARDLGDSILRDVPIEEGMDLFPGDIYLRTEVVVMSRKEYHQLMMDHNRRVMEARDEGREQTKATIRGLLRGSV